MKHLAVIDDSKDFLKKMAYNIIYGVNEKNCFFYVMYVMV